MKTTRRAPERLKGKGENKKNFLESSEHCPLYLPAVNMRRFFRNLLGENKYVPFCH